MGKLVNRAKMTVASAPGTGQLSLGTNVTGYQTFAAAGVNDGDIVSYAIEDGTTAWEIGTGTYAAATTTLARTTILASSNGGAAISASASALVFVTPLAGDLAASNVFTFSGLQIANDQTNPATKINIAAKALRLPGLTTGFAIGPVAMSVSTGTSGAGGLDTGSLAAQTGYYIHVISNGAQTAAILSLSATAPTLPAGYTFAARIGWTATDVSKNLIRITQSGKRAQLFTPLQAVTGIQGSSIGSGTTAPNMIQVAFAAYNMPATAAVMYGSAYVSNGVVIVAANGACGAYNSTSNPPPVSIDSTTPTNTPFSLVMETAQSFSYAANAANAAVYLTSWDDNL